MLTFIVHIIITGICTRRITEYLEEEYGNRNLKKANPITERKKLRRSIMTVFLCIPWLNITLAMFALAYVTAYINKIIEYKIRSGELIKDET